ncbi:SusC/RagA family TonB-linked outer membrane protein [Sphingobacterium bambusae]|uniref:SusC/RagA family TonB-linked outer membrane protein n=1 Tax=Sphingobacterium bambusae TaxID=662858 RepID=UPI002A18A326|nr:TonB-dependent receptor [Sphingobacterium bambusae]WPL51098.1 TonB-dependent receptor [Sphingobacterium bambusae]
MRSDDYHKVVPLSTQQRITGTVLDSVGSPMAGVLVAVKDKKNQTTTDLKGHFQIDVPLGSTLIFSLINHVTQEIVIGAEFDLKVILYRTSENIEEVVVTAFGRRVQREAVVGSVSTIEPDKLRVPSGNLTTALAGQVAGVIAYQQGGQPGLDNSDFFIRGVTTFGYRQNPLILIDNVELTSNDLARLQVEDIQSFSILKDASATALYGARGANGVILVTTKSGKEGRAKMNLRLDQAFSEPTRSIKLADPITYMRMYNDALITRNPKAIPFFTEDDIYNRMRTINNEQGSNKYVYPVVDWMGLMFKDRAANQRATMNINGGGSVARYMVSTSLSNDNGIIKTNEVNNFNNNVNYKNYQLRSNVNINISKKTELVVRLWGNFNDYSGPITEDASFSTDLYRIALQTSPVLFPAYYAPDDATALAQHILFGNNSGTTSNASNVGFRNPYAEMLRGYKRFSESRMSATLELNQDLENLIPGLKFNGFFSTNRYSYFANQMAYNPFYYTVSPGNYDVATNTYKLRWLNSSTLSNPLPTEYLIYASLGTNANTFIHFQGMLDYGRQFGKHSVGASLIGVRQQRQISGAPSLQESLPYRNLNIAGRMSYNFSSKYFLEVNAGMNGSERFSENNRFGFFPTIGGSWIISKESFWNENVRDVVSNLKLRASYGFTGNDDISSQRFFYLSDVNLQGNNGASFGVDNSYTRPGVIINNYENPSITWERARIFNTGLEINLFDKLDLIAEYWEQLRSNILMQRYVPLSAGLESSISANVGTATIRGLDLSLNFNQRFNEDVWLQFMSNFTFSQGRYGVYEEPSYTEPWRYRSGTLLGQTFGYLAERLFVDDAEVAASPVQLFGGELPKGGDIKYRDLNNDGVITDADKVPIGYPTTPQVIYGFGFTFGYKGFDLNMRFQGAARSNFFIDPNSTSPFMPSSGGVTQVLAAYADSHWSEENQDLYAMYPRLGTTPDQISNNLQTSTWWMRRGDFLRLKMAEIGFSLPQKTASMLHLNSARIFINGMNLFNLSNFKLWDVEQGGGAFNYPIQRVLNIGVNVNFL